MDITKVIVPAAGLGTRFLPYTKAVPKEMLPLLNRPAIQYSVEEILQSNINQCIFITNKEKESIAHHFDASESLEHILKERNQDQVLSSLNKIIKSMHFTYIRQPEPLGLGHALTLARHSIMPKEYFGVLLPDDIVFHTQPALLQLMRIARQEKASVIAVQEIPEEYISAYGVVSIKKQISPTLFQVGSIIEKPARKDAPSNLAVVGRYILSQKLFKSLDDISYTGHELHLTEGINDMIKHNEKVFAYKIQGMRYDVGNPIGWVKCIIGMALQNPHYAPHIKEYLKSLETTESFLYDSSKNLTQELSE